jgi:hypothetical protein
MLLLAILICAPSEAARLFPELLRRAVTDVDVPEGLRDMSYLGPNSRGFRAIEEKVRPIVADPLFPHAAELFIEWIPRVARFSFEVGHGLSHSYLEATPFREIRQLC